MSRRRGLADRRRVVGLSQERRLRLADALRLSVDELAVLLVRPAEIRSRPREPASGDLAVMRSLRVADCQIGGGYLYPMITAYLRDKAPSAGLSEMAGWMAHDAGDAGSAQRHFMQAVNQAQAAGDHQMAAAAFASLSHLAVHQGRTEQATAFAVLGGIQLDGRPHHPSIAARVMAMRAGADAAANDVEACTRRLAEAERLLLGADDGAPASPWAGAFDEAALAAETARCLMRLGQFPAAEREAERILVLRPPERVRSRAFAYLMLASILVARREIEAACAAVHQVLTTTRALASVPVLHELRRVEQQLTPFAGTRVAAETVTRVRADLAERHAVAAALPLSRPGLP